MKPVSVSKLVIPICLSLVLLLSACGGNREPSRWDKAQQDSTSPKPTQVANNNSPKPAKPVAGGAFNQFFPKASGDYKTVPAQEKKGFAEYKLYEKNKNVAMLSISDTANNPSAADKFKKSSDQIAGYPAVEQGKATAVLVADRYQVKVQSRSADFDDDDRKEWIEKFNLNGLSSLK